MRAAGNGCRRCDRAPGASRRSCSRAACRRGCDASGGSPAWSEAIRWPEAPSDIGTDEISPCRPGDEDDCRNETVAEADRVCEPQSVDRRQHGHPRPHQIDRMHAGIDEEIHLLRAVMDGMEPPEERSLVAQAMRPVIGGLA